ncbi:MAG TPA: CoA transferase [Phenylobacterium sp.]|jgi:formyl-CoA transferase|uniref:CaiB/BaiF CoA transferase family protein n=1 Tax=Phenylobacterium sp. TaxID=1871053 RepID=UPI002D66D352|nr:CoA transferase [Phenylobacterium sp.]HZZ68349.1 CoA transferase [Phenylobacterium sp.]
MTAALSGLKVLDCTHVIAGAYCSLVLADLGADVIKIEPPAGESTRGLRGGGFRAYDVVNRNKRAIALDLATERGAGVVRKLTETADVFVENYRPGSLDRMGLGYAQLSKINPRLVYCSVSGFGLDGPYRERGGFDLIAQAMSGLMSFVGEQGSAAPCSTAVPISDLNAGLFGVIGVLAALQSRQASGQGQHVEASLFESAMAATIWETGRFLTSGELPTRTGTRHRLAAPYEALETADGHMVVGVNSQRLWRRFCEALGEPGLAEEAGFDSAAGRMQNRDALQVRLEAILSRDTSANWVLKLEAVGVPAGPLNDIAQAWADPQIKARGLLAEVDGRRFVRTPIKLHDTPVALKRGPAEVGEHTREVLAEAGLSANEIDALIAAGAAATERKQEVPA